ncbi:hypothetical protein [Mesorhizobium waimense]|uniref:hypothetical protein n=1 Tax=Mesorhizobium waimense TaxID=1300307 RepID=UPI00142E75E8|nr:hypothetical protein [Mesorhizobium waimense]
MSAAPFGRPARRHVTVYDTPSHLGGSFTVSIVETLAGNAVKVRVWYGRATAQGWAAWKDWDGYSFQTNRVALHKRADNAAFQIAQRPRPLPARPVVIIEITERNGNEPIHCGDHKLDCNGCARDHRLRSAVANLLA